MKITKQECIDRKSEIYTLFFINKKKISEIAEELGVHRNTITKYVKKLEK